jgi:hypothetical protein
VRERMQTSTFRAAQLRRPGRLDSTALVYHRSMQNQQSPALGHLAARPPPSHLKSNNCWPFFMLHFSFVSRCSFFAFWRQDVFGFRAGCQRFQRLRSNEIPQKRGRRLNERSGHGITLTLAAGKNGYSFNCFLKINH